MSASASPAAARPSTLRIWLLAARPATLPAALAGVAVGLGAALGSGAPFRLDTAVGCVLVALLLQVVANLANDLSDFRRGADTPDRTGPVRVAAAGLVTPRQLEAAIAVVIVMAGVVGLWLAVVGGPVIVVLGVLAVVAALAYTGGPWPYGYRGLGEVFVFTFFGLVAVVGTAYLQAGRVEPGFVAAAVPVGALTTAILVVNNLRDIPTDRAAGKRTLAVMLGARATQAEYAALVAAAYLVPVSFVVLWAAGLGGPIAATAAARSATPFVPLVLLPLLTLPMAGRLLRRVRSFAEPRALNPVLKGTARLDLAFSILFALGLALAGAAFVGPAV
jgi:1,4-dihydroxy-2-naphthoate polyprenyltransferase